MRRVEITITYMEPQGKEKKMVSEMLSILEKRHLSVIGHHVDIEAIKPMTRQERKAEPPKERELPDEYPLHYGYLYIKDGEVYIHEVDRQTVAQLRKHYNRIGEPIKSFTNCDIASRNLFHLMV